MREYMDRFASEVQKVEGIQKVTIPVVPPRGGGQQQYARPQTRSRRPRVRQTCLGAGGDESPDQRLLLVVVKSMGVALFFCSALTENQRQVFLTLGGVDNLPTARPMRKDTAAFRDVNRYCEYHHDTGHTTGECLNVAKVLGKTKPTDEAPPPPPIRKVTGIPT